MGTLHPDTNQPMGDVEKFFEGVFQKLKISETTELSVSGIDEFLRGRNHNEDEIERGIGIASQVLFFESIRFVMNNTPEGSSLNEATILFDEVISQYYDEGRNFFE
ncbi:hypothetical protein JW796_00765 [Candidatus Dojkabacteria bacterium]|nr:hypothetical protein [Candidatus Dojkabacteria bacterium]